MYIFSLSDLRVGVSFARQESVVPFSLGSLSTSTHRSLNDEPLLVLIYFTEQQHSAALAVINALHDSTGLGSVLYTQEVRLKQGDVGRVFGEVGAMGGLLLRGPVVGILVDAPYSAIMEVSSLDFIDIVSILRKPSAIWQNILLNMLQLS